MTSRCCSGFVIIGHTKSSSSGYLFIPSTSRPTTNTARGDNDVPPYAFLFGSSRSQKYSVFGTESRRFKADLVDRMRQFLGRFKSTNRTMKTRKSSSSTNTLLDKTFRTKVCSFLLAVAIALSSAFGPAVLPADAASDSTTAPSLHTMRPMTMAEDDAYAVEEEEVAAAVDETAWQQTAARAEDDYEAEVGQTGMEKRELSETVSDHTIMTAGGGSKVSKKVLKNGGGVLAATTGASALLIATKSKTADQTEENKSESEGEEGGEASIGIFGDSVDNTQQSLPLSDPKHLEARNQPKPPEEEAALAARYAAISDLGERAFQIIVDLGMIEVHV